jgi:enoyl-CoA hydratase/carnithine racemase
MAVTLAVADGVATVTVDNPPVNALDDPTLIGLRETVEEAGGREDVRAVVLTGAGEKAFIAGADLRSLSHALGPEGDAGLMDAHVGLTGPAFAALTGLEVPVIAAVGANAVGGGLELALCCDLIVADPRARFGLPEVTLGLMPGGGGTQRLARRAGAAAAMELVLLGRVIDAARARELGIVNIVADEGEALAETQRLAQRLARLPAVALRSAKRAVRAGLDSGLAEGVALERELFLAVARTADAREGAGAFLEKRKPAFEHW